MLKRFSGFIKNENSGGPDCFSARFHGELYVHAVHRHGTARSEAGVRQLRSLATEGGVQPAEKLRQECSYQVKLILHINVCLLYGKLC